MGIMVYSLIMGNAGYFFIINRISLQEALSDPGFQLCCVFFGFGL